MRKTRSKSEWAFVLIVPLYSHRFIQTLWNTEDSERQKNGWVLKNGIWSPWFFNMRPIGDAPELFSDICRSMVEMMWDYLFSLMIGVEMAGVPLVGGLSNTFVLYGRPQRFGYTRPLPRKVRTPIEALQLFREMDVDVAGYGQKDFVEARFRNGDQFVVVDDMATDLGSKIIARSQTLWEASRRGVEVSCDKVFYFLNRGKGNREKAENFADEKEQGLHPIKLSVNYIIEFDENLPDLRKTMQPEEFEVISEFQNNTSQFQDKDVQRKVLEMAAAGK